MKDLHDPKYDYLEISADYKSFETDSGTRRYTGVKVFDETSSDGKSTGAYRIRVYPDQLMEDEFTTNQPWLYAGAVMLVMATAIATFVMYDCYVERRQTKVKDMAFKSNAIVSSLFPAAVQKKLMKEQEAKLQSVQREQKSSMLTPKMFNKMNPLAPPQRNSVSFNEDGDNVNRHPMMIEEDDELNLNSTTPIADLFPSATVLFMDVSKTGFFHRDKFHSKPHHSQPFQNLFRLLDLQHGAVHESLGKYSCC